MDIRRKPDICFYMQERASKEKVLKNLRKSLLQKDVLFSAELDYDTSLFTLNTSDKIPGLDFLSSFTQTGNKVFFCDNVFHFLESFFDFCIMHGYTKVFADDVRLGNILQTCGVHTLERIEESELIVTLPQLYSETGSIVYHNSNYWTESSFSDQHIVYIGFNDQFTTASKAEYGSLITTEAKSRMNSLMLEHSSIVNDSAMKKPKNQGVSYLFFIDEPLTI